MSSGNSRNAKLKEAFRSAKTIQEMLKTFQEMETCFKESELGKECYILTQKFFTETTNLDQVIYFGKRALTILTANNARSQTPDPNSIFLLSRIYSVLGSVYFKLQNAQQCLRYLNLAEKYLKMMGEDDYTLVTALSVQQDFFNLKSTMHKFDEALVHASKVLEISEKIMDKGCVELGEINKKVAEACFTAYDHEKALPYCLKALEIYSKCLGPDSEEVAQVRRYLALVYEDSGQHEKAFECNQLAQSALKVKAPNSLDLLKAEIDAANMKAGMGKYQEAVDILKRVLERSDIEEFEQARVSINMARSLCHLKKFADARKYLTAAKGVLEKKETLPMYRIIGFADMTDMYEMMEDFETAISLIKGALAVPELPEKHLLSLSSRLFSLMSVSGKKTEGILYMEGLVKRLKKSFGPKHYEVGCGYARLGAAYTNSGQMELAAKYLANAKEIFVASLGPRHLESLQISHDLSLIYESLGRFPEALQIEEKVVECLKGLPASELGFMHKVNKHLIKLRERVAESPTAASSQSKDEEGLAMKISVCSISDDGQVLNYEVIQG